MLSIGSIGLSSLDLTVFLMNGINELSVLKWFQRRTVRFEQPMNL